MTDRERWIIYPLLFFALGTSLHDKLGLPAERLNCQEIHAEKIQCNNLESIRQKTQELDCTLLNVMNTKQQPVVRMGSNVKDATGILDLLTPSGEPRLRLSIAEHGQAGQFELFHQLSEKPTSLAFGISAAPNGTLQLYPLMNMPREK
jgi:hypothetical protein